MAERKTTQNNASVKDFLNSIKNDRRREDSLVLAKLMRSVSGKKPKMWGPSIVGFGKHEYEYANGKPGEICKIGFAPRVQALVLYLSNFDGRAKLLKKLGKHRMSGGGCLYINKLDDIDLDILTSIIEKAHERN
jgi:hypothetical protein